jgi:two-component system alkaline phosphatase synthesis response regulator PhoP
MFTVLTVDDNEDLRSLLAIMLEKLGCKPVGARNGVDGEVMALRYQPDLILLDIMMDEQDGYVTCRNLRAKGYTGRIVFISALSPETGKMKAQECGADGYVAKPITLSIVREQVRLAQLQTA